MTLPAQEVTRLTHMLQADGLPGVLISNRPLRDISREVLEHLSHTKTPIYVRHGQLVRIQRMEDGTPFIEPLGEAALKGMLARAMNMVKLTVKGPQHVPPPDNVVKDILTLGSWSFPPLDSIVEFPVFRPDGTLIEKPGYDAATRLAYAPLPTLIIPRVPEMPTEEDVVNALALIDEAIGEFPYQDEASYANAIGLLLTPLIRQAIRGHVPLALIDATRPGTGKSLLAETVAMIATGRKAAMMTAPYDDDEWRKRIASTLAEGATIIIIDNVKARLQAASLDAALTSFTVKERILGQNKNGVYAQRATWMATGNNIQIGGDLPRRSYWIRMDAHTDKPWARGGFRHNLEEWVPANRGRLIAALLTLARAWFAAGKPPAQVPRMGSFQAWTNTIGGILAFAWPGECPFLSNLNALYEQADDDATQWAAFLHAWSDYYGEKEVLVSQLTKDLKSGSFDGGDTTLGVAGLFNSLPDDLTDIQKGDFKKRLGKALASRVGSHFDESGLHLVKTRVDKRSGAVYWRVAGLQVSQVSIPQKEDFSYQNLPLEQVGNGLEGNIPSEKNGEVAENKPAKPANLQDGDEVVISPDEQGRWCEHLKLFDLVTTPKGNGIVIQNWPRRVGVRLSATQETVYFVDPDEIAQVLVVSSVPLGPDDWPYNDPAWTDARLVREGYLSRQALGYPPPNNPSAQPEPPQDKEVP